MFEKAHSHLKSVGEDYLTHLCFALKFGSRMIGGGLAAICHGFCPAVFERTGSQTLIKLHDELKARLEKQTDDHR